MKLRKHENNVLAWKGDAALLFVARLVLTEIYPTDMPIKLLMERQEKVVSNNGLANYCKRHNLTYGCNVMEIKIGEMVIGGRINEAKEIVKDIIAHNVLIKRMDEQQMADGGMSKEFLEKEKIKEHLRFAKRKFFDKAEALIPKKKRHYLFPYLCSICNFIEACKYSLMVFFQKNKVKEL